jgi:uncharacterized YceG family protein
VTDWSDDPFLSEDPAAREREQRRREREAKRREKAAREAEKQTQAAEREELRRRQDEERRELDAARERQEAERAEAARAAQPVAPAPLPAPETAEEEYEPQARGRLPSAPLASPSEPWVDMPAHGDGDVPTGEEPWAHEIADGGEGSHSFLGRLVRRPLLWAGLVVLGLVAWFAISLFQPFGTDPGAKVVVKVPRGATVSEIADLLDEQGVIPSSTLFEVRATLAGHRSDLLAGNYSLTEGMSYGDAIDALLTPAPQRSQAITIPEALAREQIAEVVRDTGLEGSYVQATDGSKLLDPTEYGAKDPNNLEGFLFPSTYELKPKATAEDLVAKQLEAFKENIESVDMSYAESKNLTPYDVLTIASIIEKEAALEDDQPLVAAVIYNRLDNGMTLGMDATVRYATGKFDYTEPLLESELALDSPYNTRINTGLPPTPIANPGLSSIEAAANPADVDYLYFVTKPGGCGELDFATTAEEADADSDAYHAAREAAGGRSPVDEC